MAMSLIIANNVYYTTSNCHVYRPGKMKTSDLVILMFLAGFFSATKPHTFPLHFHSEKYTPLKGFIWLLIHCGYKQRLSHMIIETTHPHTCAISPSDWLQQILDKNQSAAFVQGFLFGDLRWLSWLRHLSKWSVEWFVIFSREKTVSMHPRAAH